MTLYPPLYQQADSYSAQVDRQLVDALVAAGGILLNTDMAVSQRGAGANMSVDVAAGKCVVPGTDSAGQGKYLCWSDAVVNVPIAGAPPAGQSRIDLIVCQVRDSTVIGGANNDFTIATITGVAAATGTQVAPAVPNSAVVLAQIAVGPTVANIVNANITDMRSMAGMRQRILAGSGPPTTGNWNAGDKVVDNTNHVEWLCTAGGSPGTWKTVGSSFEVRYWRSAAYNLPTAAYSPFIYDALVYDNSNGAYSTANGKYTCPAAGIYRYNFQAAIGVVASTLSMQVVKNGTGEDWEQITVTATSAAGYYGVKCHSDVQCAAGDTLSAQLWASVATGILNNSALTKMSIARIG